MKKPISKYSSLKESEKGSIAIMMVITAVIIIMPVMVNFTFDVNLNKLKVYNKEDRLKARLSAESGLKFAMARLLLYKEAYNFLENNNKAKSIVKQESLDLIWNFPFLYPIPQNEKMNAIQKEAISDFHENTVLDGKLQLTINNISNKMNLNVLRISLLLDAQKEREKAGDSSDESSTDEENTEFNTEAQLFNILNDSIQSKGEEDESFSSEFQNIEVDTLINELKYFISDPHSIANAEGGDSAFTKSDIAPKRAPLTSFTELYSLPSWPDTITNLISNEFTIHGALMVDLNKITEQLLKVLIPSISEEEVTEFFKYKNDPDKPQYYNSLDDFKNYIVNIANIITEAKFTERFKKFKQQGLNFGPTPTLFKVSCYASVGRATYKLIAYVILPTQPLPRKIKKPQEEPAAPIEPEVTEGAAPPPIEESPIPPPPEAPEESKEDKKTLLLDPRIVEIIIG